MTTTTKSTTRADMLALPALPPELEGWRWEQLNGALR